LIAESLTPVSAKRTLILRLIRAVALIYLLGTVLGGVGLGWIALHPPKNPISEREEHNVQAAAQAASVEFRDVDLSASDGAVLRAWFLRPHVINGNTVVLLHGVSDNRLGMYGYGEWLLENHYTVLIPDARAHGNSGGKLATYGLMEADDIHHWVDWIEANEHPKCLFALGESMGASQLLQSLPKEPRFCAVVAESPFATFREVAYARFGRAFHTGPWIGETFFRPTVEIGFLFVRLGFGLNMDAASPEQAVEGTTIPVLLIHGLNDRNIPSFHSDEIRAHNPSDIVLWKVPGAAHTKAHKVAPQEFERRVLAWFAAHALPSPETR
jgi:pimeloyl-ACP methyl ester carboxylesterase